MSSTGGKGDGRLPIVNRQWPCVRLGEVAQVVSGVTLGRRGDRRETREVPYSRVANVKDGRLDLSDVYSIQATESEIEKCRLRRGDILLTEGGDPDKLGRGTFWQEQIRECIHQNHIFRVRLPAEAYCPEFVSYQFGSPYGKAYFLAHAKQATGIASINRGVLERFSLITPPLPEQRRIAARLKEQLAAVEQARAKVQAQLAELDALPNALLREAFGGAA